MLRIPPEKSAYLHADPEWLPVIVVVHQLTVISNPHLACAWYRARMSGTYQVVMGDRGRLVIPADLRERAGLAEGTALILLETPTGLVLLTRPQLQKLVQADLAGLDLVGELLSERRAEAAAEDAA
jgi:AbrB family looped-hinge helix DNA binding protein